jgi:NTE family protein
MPRRTRVALALGAGGARGYAHIGVIEVLEERGFDIVGVAGTSMGALVGGLHAAGALAAYTDWVRTLTQRDVLRLLDPSLRAPGAIRAGKILAKVGDLIGDARIEDLPLPFTAVATDLVARKEVWFQRGRLDAAIRASIALPSAITPVVLNGRLLVDGGLLNPIPVAATASMPADLTVAVALSEEQLSTAGTTVVGETAEPRPLEESIERLRRSAAQVLDADVVRKMADWLPGRVGERSRREADELEEVEEVDAPVFGALPSGLRTLDVMQLSLEALQSVVARYRLAGYPPDILVTVPKTACRTLDFHRAEEMIALGRERAEAALERDAALLRD